MLTKTTVSFTMVALFLLLTHSLFAHFETKEFPRPPKVDNIQVSTANNEAPSPGDTETSMPDDESLSIADIETPAANNEILKYVDFVSGQSLYQIKEMARKNNKPIFLDFYANWCGPCNLMDQEVFNDPSVAAYMNANFINYKANVNTRAGSKLAYRYNIKMLPTLIIISADGNVLVKESKFMDSAEFISFAERAIL